MAGPKINKDEIFHLSPDWVPKSAIPFLSQQAIQFGRSPQSLLKSLFYAFLFILAFGAADILSEFAAARFSKDRTPPLEVTGG
jgi:hypothetical protein